MLELDGTCQAEYDLHQGKSFMLRLKCLLTKRAVAKQNDYQQVQNLAIKIVDFLKDSEFDQSVTDWKLNQEIKEYKKKSKEIINYVCELQDIIKGQKVLKRATIKNKV